MNFKKTDRLNAIEILQLITSKYTQDIAKMIANKLEKYCFVMSNTFYELQPNITYKVTSNTYKTEIINKVSSLIQTSFKKLDDKDRRNIELEYQKEHLLIFKNSNIETYYPQLLYKLTKTDIVFNVTLGEVHFNNGYVNTLKGTFHERETNKHYITKYITRDYEKSSEKQRASVLKHIKKVYPNKDDLKCLLLYLGSALSWKGTTN